MSPIKKIADLPKPSICRHPDHNPPAHIVFKPGIYEHTCPKCGSITSFTVPHSPSFKIDEKEKLHFFYYLGAVDGILKSLSNGGKPDFNFRYKEFFECHYKEFKSSHKKGISKLK